MHNNDQRIDDIPQRATLKVLTPVADRRRGSIDWVLAERLGRARLWEPILTLPVPKGGDDFYPPAIDPLEDKYSGA